MIRVGGRMDPRDALAAAHEIEQRVAPCRGRCRIGGIVEKESRRAGEEDGVVPLQVLLGNIGGVVCDDGIPGPGLLSEGFDRARRKRNRRMDKARGPRKHEHRARLLGRRRGALGERGHHLQQVGHARYLRLCGWSSAPTLRGRLRTRPAWPAAGSRARRWCAAFRRRAGHLELAVHERNCQEHVLPLRRHRDQARNQRSLKVAGVFQEQVLSNERDVGHGRAWEDSSGHRRHDAPALDLHRHEVGRRSHLRCDRRSPVTDEWRRLSW